MAAAWHPITCCQPGETAFEAGGVRGADITLSVEGPDVEDHDAMRFPQYVVSQMSTLQSKLLGEHAKAVSSLRAENLTLRKKLFVLEKDRGSSWPGLQDPMTQTALDLISAEPLLQEDLDNSVPDERESELGLQPGPDAGLDTKSELMRKQYPFEALVPCESTRISEGTSQVTRIFGSIEADTSGSTRKSEVMRKLGMLETQQQSLSDKIAQVLQQLSGPTVRKTRFSTASWQGTGSSSGGKNRFSVQEQGICSVPLPRTSQGGVTAEERRTSALSKVAEGTRAEGEPKNAQGASRGSVGSGEVTMWAGAMSDGTADLLAGGTSQRERIASMWRVSRGNTKELTSEATSTNSISAMWRYGAAGGRSCLAQVVNSGGFVIVCSMIIFSYAVFIACETEILANTPGREMHDFAPFHIMYSLLFSAELLMRVGAEGCDFFFGRGSFFNWFDSALVISIFIDLAIMSASDSALATAGSMMRTLRIIRIFRTMRLARVFHHMHEFQKMAFALASCIKTLLCSLLVVFFVMFFFAVIFTQGAADEGFRERIRGLRYRYGSLVSTLHTLFLSVSNGIAWDAAYLPLYQMGPWFGRAFLLYISISLFGVMNVVTSIFVESVIRSAAHHRDVIVQDKEKDKLVTVGHMQEVFKQMDLDGSGEITSDELEYFLSEPDLRRYMEALDVSPEDTRLLFSLLDRDGSNVIDIDEFCEGCLRLKGNARSIDMHTLILQMKNFLCKWADFTDYAAERFEQLDNLGRKSLTKSLHRLGSTDSQVSPLSRQSTNRLASVESLVVPKQRQSTVLHGESPNRLASAESAVLPKQGPSDQKSPPMQGS